MENSESLSTVTISYIGWLEFFSRIIEAAAWPALITFLAFRYGKHLISIIPNIETFKVPGIEAVFKVVGNTREAAKEIEGSAKEISEETEPADKKELDEIASFLKHLLYRSDEDPIDTIMQLNGFIQKKLDLLNNICEHRKFDDNHKTIFEINEQATHKVYQIDALWQSGWISDAELKVISNLNRIIREVREIENRTISSIIARESIRLAGPLINSISAKIKEIEATAQPV